ncbi:primosomal replication protein N [Chitiniphilus purpureus]|uniref:Primosomal replication protein N n=1 Tax=Chitiniphilus purpureus TaxID=2981137 RepID=A0ABY6DHA7_9NEIS|nr:primosomal replication protein N [Chitiniphilus sp. CD1]UXY13729.1 primosomal replication protein N [Chitiniphilus sp. CD1]
MLDGTLLELPALRHTPAGIAVQEMVIGHESQQQENGAPRRVLANVKAVSVGTQAIAMGGLQLGQALRVHGFLAAASQRYPDRLVLHIDEYELLN